MPKQKQTLVIKAPRIRPVAKYQRITYPTHYFTPAQKPSHALAHSFVLYDDDKAYDCKLAAATEHLLVPPRDS